MFKLSLVVPSYEWTPRVNNIIHPKQLTFKYSDWISNLHWFIMLVTVALLEAGDQALNCTFEVMWIFRIAESNGYLIVWAIVNKLILVGWDDVSPLTRNGPLWAFYWASIRIGLAQLRVQIHSRGLVLARAFFLNRNHDFGSYLVPPHHPTTRDIGTEDSFPIRFYRRDARQFKRLQLSWSLGIRRSLLHNPTRLFSYCTTGFLSISV